MTHLTPADLTDRLASALRRDIVYDWIHDEALLSLALSPNPELATSRLMRRIAERLTDRELCRLLEVPAVDLDTWLSIDWRRLARSYIDEHDY